MTNYQDMELLDYVAERLAELARLAPNWDGYGAPVIGRATREAAMRLAKALPRGLALRPHVSPMSTGQLQFEFTCGSRELELEIEAPDTVHYLKWWPDGGVEEEGTYPLSDSARTASLIQWLSRDGND